MIPEQEIWAGEPVIVLTFDQAIDHRITAVTHKMYVHTMIESQHSTLVILDLLIKLVFLACSSRNTTDGNKISGSSWSYEFCDLKICRSTEGDTASLL